MCWWMLVLGTRVGLGLLANVVYTYDDCHEGIGNVGRPSSPGPYSRLPSLSRRPYGGGPESLPGRADARIPGE